MPGESIGKVSPQFLLKNGVDDFLLENKTEEKKAASVLTANNGSQQEVMQDPLTDASPASFEFIYKTALNGDPNKELKYLISTKICINVRNSQSLTPAGKLAKEGRIAAAELLRNLGADVNSIASGAAESNRQEYFYILLNLHGAGVKWIVKGLAQGGFEEDAERLRIEHGVDVNWIAAGAAQGGFEKYAERLRTKHWTDVNDVNCIARGAAQGGFEKYAERLRIEHGANVNWIAQAAAQGGFEKYAERLRIKHGANVDFIAAGAAQGGFEKYAERLRTEHGANVGDIASGAAKGGHREYAQKLRENHVGSGWFMDGITVNIITAASSVPHNEYIEFLLAQYIIPSGFEYRNLENFNDQKALRELAFIHSDDLRKIMIRNAQEKAHLLPKAKQINRLMHTKSYDYDQGLALITPEVQGLCLYGGLLFSAISKAKDIFALIMSYSAYLSHQDANDLVDKEAIPEMEARTNLMTVYSRLSNSTFFNKQVKYPCASKVGRRIEKAETETSYVAAQKDVQTALEAGAKPSLFCPEATREFYESLLQIVKPTK